MMCQDSQKRVWVGGVEVAGQIGTTGLKPEWVDVDCLATPAYEYESQSDSWGNQALRKNPYIDMYANYISKIPLIRKYVQRSRK